MSAEERPEAGALIHGGHVIARPDGPGRWETNVPDGSGRYLVVTRAPCGRYAVRDGAESPLCVSDTVAGVARFLRVVLASWN